MERSRGRDGSAFCLAQHILARAHASAVRSAFDHPRRLLTKLSPFCACLIGADCFDKANHHCEKSVPDFVQGRTKDLPLTVQQTMHILLLLSSLR